MPLRREIPRVFWPEDLLHPSVRRGLDRSEPKPAPAWPPQAGFLVGWNVRGLSAAVACVVNDADTTLGHLERSLALLAGDGEMKSLWEGCAGPPTVLGRWQPRKGELCAADAPRAHVELLRRQTRDRRASAVYWVTVGHGAADGLPAVEETAVCGRRYRGGAQVVLYRRPEGGSLYASAPLTFGGVLSRQWLSRSGLAGRAAAPPAPLDRTLHQLNCSGLVRRLVRRLVRLDELPAPSVGLAVAALAGLPPERGSGGGASGSSGGGGGSESGSGACRRALLLPFHATLLLLRAALGAALGVLGALGGVLRPRSVLARHLERRFRGAVGWPASWARLQAERRDGLAGEALRERRAALALGLYGRVAGVLADVALGCALGALARAHGEAILGAVRYGGHALHSDVMRSQVRWLAGMPAGMKLNPSLNRRLGSMVLYALDLYDSLVASAAPLEPTLVAAVSWTGLLGASAMFAAASDLVTLFTVHIDVVHTAFARLYGTMLGALASLFRLFRGKKKNVLRRRVDSCHFDMDQLVAGTIAFTLVVFLFPTVATYYVFFSVVRLLVTGTQAALWSGIAFCSYFPIFSVLVYLFVPGRIPGGVNFRIVRVGASSAAAGVAAAAEPTATSPPPPPAASSATTPVSAHAAASPHQAHHHYHRLHSGRVDGPGGAASPAAAAASPVSPTQQAVLRPVSASTTYLRLRSTKIAASALFFEFRVVFREIMSRYTPGRLVRTFATGERFDTQQSSSVRFAKEAPVMPLADVWRLLRS